MKSLTPKQIVAELDQHIVGQAAAKRAVAVAIRNRWRRQQLPEGVRKDIWPKNILMIGSTGVGKTEIARRLAGLTGSPFVKVEATKFTEVGYHGRDVDSMVRDLLDASINMVRNEMTEQVKGRAEQEVERRLLDMVLQTEMDSDDESVDPEKVRNDFRDQLRAGQLDERLVEITVEEQATAAGLLGKAALDMDVEFQTMFEKMMPARRDTKRMAIREARRVLFTQEADKLIDRSQINAQAIARVEDGGIIFIDEIDKIAGSDKSDGPDVSRQGVQRDLLPIVEGSTVTTRQGPVQTQHILFIAAGAFHDSSPSDLMPEFQGRFPIRVELQDLTRDDLIRILREPKNSLTEQQIALLKTEGVAVSFADDAIELMAQMAFDINRRGPNIGARRLYTIMERVFESISFDAPDLQTKTIKITADYVRQRLAEVSKGNDRSRFVL